MDLVDDREHAVGVETELVLGVDQHQTGLGPARDAVRRQGDGRCPGVGDSGGGCSVGAGGDGAAGLH